MRRSRAPSWPSAQFCAGQFWADCITNTAGPDFRQAHRRKPREARFRIFRTEHREKQKSLRMTRLAASLAAMRPQAWNVLAVAAGDEEFASAAFLRVLPANPAQRPAMLKRRTVLDLLDPEGRHGVRDGTHGSKKEGERARQASVWGESEADCTRPDNIDMSSGVLARRRQLGSISRARAMTCCACLSRPPRAAAACGRSLSHAARARTHVDGCRHPDPGHQGVPPGVAGPPCCVAAINGFRSRSLRSTYLQVRYF
jgi:hypothetical protein